MVCEQRDSFFVCCVCSTPESRRVFGVAISTDPGSKLLGFPLLVCLGFTYFLHLLNVQYFDLNTLGGCVCVEFVCVCVSCVCVSCV